VFEHLGEALRLLRHRRRLSLNELARRAKVGGSQLSRYERGHQLPHLAQLERLLVALGLGFNDLAAVLDFLETPPRNSEEERLVEDPGVVRRRHGLLPQAVENALEALAAAQDDLRVALRDDVLRGGRAG
jgi:transcriptional regulator with XRE-family HTH domain